MPDLKKYQGIKVELESGNIMHIRSQQDMRWADMEILLELNRQQSDMSTYDPTLIPRLISRNVIGWDFKDPVTGDKIEIPRITEDGSLSCPLELTLSQAQAVVGAIASESNKEAPLAEK